MQLNLVVHNIIGTDIECEWREPAVPNQLQSVEDPYPGTWGMQAFLAGMALSVEQQEAIRQATVGQLTNTNWHTMRRGRLTASNFAAVVRAKFVTPLLLKRVLRSVKWGTDNEEGIKAFKMATEMDVQESGLLVHGVWDPGCLTGSSAGHHSSDRGTLPLKRQ
jgi:hypothetical protein